MGRKRLTQFFPGLLPLRKRQKIFCYYMGMRLDHNRYSEKIPHLHSVHNGSRIRHLHERGDADGTAQENRIEAENSVG